MALPSSMARRVARIEPAHLTDGRLWTVVFGPGHGEAVMVRLPDGRVGIVDGCREPARDCPVTRLLAGLKATRLLFACLTHPHEDHYKGLGRLLELYRGRVDHVWHVLALSSRERAGVVAYAKRHHARPKRAKLPDTGDAQGVERVFREIMAAGTVGAYRRQLVTDRGLLREQVAGAEFAIDSWGPTDADTSDAVMEFLATPRKDWNVKDDLPNQVSGALLVRWGESRVLLAGDLYAHTDDRRGWGPARALASLHAPVQVVNASHHASHNAYDDKLWNAMNPSLAIITPFLNASLRADPKTKRLEPCQPPKPADIRRLLDGRCEVAITAPPRWIGETFTPTPPYQRRIDRGPATPTVSTSTGTLALLGASAVPDVDDTQNAVAVALDAGGNILEVILAGGADFYD